MGAEVWGTFAVNDHCRSNAFVREVLLFDRVVLPFPSTPQERVRWSKPDPNSTESWDPDRLDALIGILGTQHAAGHKGARLAWTAPWTEYKWQYEKSRTKVAKTISDFDAFYSTRCILAMGEDLPQAVEAVAAFPGEREWREEAQPSAQQPADITAASAIIMFARPLLMPPGAEDDAFGPLRAAVELATDEEFRRCRAAYFDWMRTFVALFGEGKKLDEVKLRDADVKLAKERLEGLLNEERKIVQGYESRKAWTAAEYALTAVGTTASVALAMMNPLWGLGVAAPLASFGGWVASKRTARPEPSSTSLGGASMFVAAERRLPPPI